MNKCELAAALQAWTMAINHVAATSNNSGVELEDLAHSYGSHTSTTENIDEVSHLINWDKLLTILDEVQK